MLLFSQLQSFSQVSQVQWLEVPLCVLSLSSAHQELHCLHQGPALQNPAHIAVPFDFYWNIIIDFFDVSVFFLFAGMLFFLLLAVFAHFLVKKRGIHLVHQCLSQIEQACLG